MSASRWWTACRSSTSRSLAGRIDELTTVGTANRARRISKGCTDTSSPMVMISRTIQLSVDSTAMYMWSSTKIWLRSTASRSR